MGLSGVRKLKMGSGRQLGAAAVIFCAAGVLFGGRVGYTAEPVSKSTEAGVAVEKTSPQAPVPTAPVPAAAEPVNSIKPAAVLTEAVAVSTAEGSEKKRPAKAESGSAKDKEYILQKGDHLKITVYPEDDYIKGGAMEVSSEGNITLPLAGKIEVAGKSAIAAEHEIAEILARDYLVNPEVVMEVTEKYAAAQEKVIVLLGQVKSPGNHPFPKTGRFTLLQAIAVAGGFSDVANIKKIKIIRGGEDKGTVLRANADDIISGKKQDIELQDGDIINVAESIF